LSVCIYEGTPAERWSGLAREYCVNPVL